MTHRFLQASAFIAVFLAAASATQGATVEAKSPALADVKSAIASAHEGDTVTVPAGTASWTSTLVITKGITLQGATSISGSLSSPVVSDQTIILDDIPRPSRGHPPPKQQQGPPQEAEPLLSRTAAVRGQKDGPSKLNKAAGPKGGHMLAIVKVTLKPTQSFRLTGFTFRFGSVTAFGNGGVHLAGTCPSTRIDHCHFDQLYGNPFIMTHGQIYGVVDHCVFDARQRASSFQVYHDGWGGHTHGDGSWADDNHFGSNQFLFIETNTFRRQPGSGSGGSIDCYGGGRYVARYNYFNDAIPNSHGTESSGRFRGTRAVEIYNNTINSTASHQALGQLRSGTLLQHNNTWTGSAGDRKGHSIVLTCYRLLRPFPFWGGANGTNRLDSNDPHGLYASGKHTGENNSATLVVANVGWNANQWVGYSLTNTTKTVTGRTGAIFHPSSYVTANTNDTITLRGNDMGPAMTFNTGDAFQIYKLLAALDQPGRGKGDLLADKDPVVTGSWPHQALEPVYAWGNTYNNSRQLDVASGYPTIQENRDFYNQRTPFDGTVGVGVGKLAERPKTCTPGVAYWATDQGEWDSTHEGPDGQLYVCTAPNSWSLFYKPYTYPHPLVSGIPAPVVNRADNRETTTEATPPSNK